LVRSQKQKCRAHQGLSIGTKLIEIITKIGDFLGGQTWLRLTVVNKLITQVTTKRRGAVRVAVSRFAGQPSVSRKKLEPLFWVLSSSELVRRLVTSIDAPIKTWRQLGSGNQSRSWRMIGREGRCLQSSGQLSADLSADWPDATWQPSATRSRSLAHAPIT